VAGGGGGAGAVGVSGGTLVNSHCGSGGDGEICVLNGIKNFGSYGTYYWGGGVVVRYAADRDTPLTAPVYYGVLRSSAPPHIINILHPRLSLSMIDVDLC
jgi:hypothetical protein